MSNSEKTKYLCLLEMFFTLRTHVMFSIPKMQAPAPLWVPSPGRHLRHIAGMTMDPTWNQHPPWVPKEPQQNRFSLPSSLLEAWPLPIRMPFLPLELQTHSRRRQDLEGELHFVCRAFRLSERRVHKKKTTPCMGEWVQESELDQTPLIRTLKWWWLGPGDPVVSECWKSKVTCSAVRQEKLLEWSSVV